MEIKTRVTEIPHILLERINLNKKGAVQGVPDQRQKKSPETQINV